VIDRVTSQTRMLSAQQSLQSSAAALARLHDTASTMKKIAVPSDDPSGTADSLRVRLSQSAVAQYSRNIDDAQGWLSTVDSTLTSTTDLLRRVRDLTVQGANDGTLSPTAKEAIATELDGLRSDLLRLANTTYSGRTVFAGTSDSGVAFNPDYSANAAAGTVQRRLDATSTVQVDSDGVAVFGQGAGSAFALIDSIAADLRSGVNVGAHLTEIDQFMTAASTEQSKVGARQSQIARAKETNLSMTNSLEVQRSSVEDVDPSEIVLKLQQQETAYQVALAVTARTLQPTLMDFLR